MGRDFFQVANTYDFEQNASKYFFFQGSLCVHFYGKKVKNTVFQAKILFFALKNTLSYEEFLMNIFHWELYCADRKRRRSFGTTRTGGDTTATWRKIRPQSPARRSETSTAWTSGARTWMTCRCPSAGREGGEAEGVAGGGAEEGGGGGKRKMRMVKGGLTPGPEGEKLFRRNL